MHKAVWGLNVTMSAIASIATIIALGRMLYIADTIFANLAIHDRCLHGLSDKYTKHTYFKSYHYVKKHHVNNKEGDVMYYLTNKLRSSIDTIFYVFASSLIASSAIIAILSLTIKKGSCHPTI